MGKLNSYEPRAQKGSGVPMYSKECSFMGCNEKTRLALMTVVKPDGYEAVGPASDFGIGSIAEFRLREGYMFRNWITRCSEHAAADADRMTRALQRETSEQKRRRLGL